MFVVAYFLRIYLVTPITLHNIHREPLLIVPSTSVRFLILLPFLLPSIFNLLSDQFSHEIANINVYILQPQASLPSFHRFTLFS